VRFKVKPESLLIIELLAVTSWHLFVTYHVCCVSRREYITTHKSVFLISRNYETVRSYDVLVDIYSLHTATSVLIRIFELMFPV